MNVTSSTISGNTSNGLGAGLFANAGNVAIESSTITLNDSSGANGAGVTAFETTTINNSIVAGNVGGPVTNLAGQPGGSNFSGDFNLLGPGDETGGANDILVNDNNPLLGALADNGGPTQTHVLLAGSPALDAGNSTLTTDQRGQTRPVDFVGIANSPAAMAAILAPSNCKTQHLSSLPQPQPVLQKTRLTFSCLRRPTRMSLHSR